MRANMNTERLTLEDGVCIDTLLLLAKNVLHRSERPRACGAPYLVPEIEWLALQAEVMERLRASAREACMPEPAPAPADEPPPLPEPAWMTQLCGHDPHYFYTADQMRARDDYWIAKLQAERSQE
jgi:hypothetical protein